MIVGACVGMYVGETVGSHVGSGVGGLVGVVPMGLWAWGKTNAVSSELKSRAINTLAAHL